MSELVPGAGGTLGRAVVGALRRPGALLRSVRAVSLADAVAPACGVSRLGPYLSEAATRRPPP